MYIILYHSVKMSTRSVFLEDIAFTVMNLALVCRLLFQAPFAWVAFQQPYQDHAELSIPLCIVTRRAGSIRKQTDTIRIAIRTKQYAIRIDDTIQR